MLGVSDVLVSLTNSYYLSRWVAKRVVPEWKALCEAQGANHYISCTRAGPISRLVVLGVSGTEGSARSLMAMFRRMAGLPPSVLD